jgi:hypothetical protein
VIPQFAGWLVVHPELFPEHVQEQPLMQLAIDALPFVWSPSQFQS